MGQSGGESIGKDDDNSGSGVGGDGDVYKGSVKPVLVLLSNLHSDKDSVSVSDSKPSSRPTYAVTGYFVY